MTDPISITLTCEILGPLALNPLETHRHDHEELWIITHGTQVTQYISIPKRFRRR